VTLVGDSKLTGSSIALGDLILGAFLTSTGLIVFCFNNALYNLAEPAVASGLSSLLVFCFFTDSGEAYNDSLLDLNN